MRLKTILLSLMLVGFFTGCSTLNDIRNNKNIKSYGEPKTPHERHRDRHGKFFGEDTFKWSSKKAKEAAGGGAIGVNAFLWRASLDTISFMPLSSADPFGGVIITDWYSLPENVNERNKINIKIVGRELRASAIKVNIFRQGKNQSGEWVTLKVEPENMTKIEDAILTRARELRIADVRD